jgi:hypothetical protein
MLPDTANFGEKDSTLMKLEAKQGSWVLIFTPTTYRVKLNSFSKQAKVEPALAII